MTVYLDKWVNTEAILVKIFLVEPLFGTSVEGGHVCIIVC